MQIHVVQPGDSLFRIAQQYGTSVQYLVQQNEFREPNRLTPGQTVVIPQPTQTYVVKRGDTLETIAAQNGTTVLALWQNNPQLGGIDRVYPGQTLNLSFGNKIGALAVNGYAYPNIDMRVLRRTLPYLTYLSVFSFGFDANGRVIPQNVDLLNRMAAQYGVKPIMVLSTVDANGQFSSDKAAALLHNMAAQQNLINSLSQTLAANGFYGVDVDFEYIPPEDGEAYATFIQNLRERLSSENKVVFVSLAPKTSEAQRGLLYEAHDYAKLGNFANNALVMSYEWGYSLSEPMAVAPINKVAEVIGFATSVIPRERIFMGIPNYGYDWTLPYVAGQSRAQTIGNVQATEQAIQYGAPIQYDELAQSPHYNYWRNRAEHEVWFEDARSIRAKLALASEYQIRGVSIWNIMRYFPQLWLVLNQLYNIEKIN